MFERFRRDKNKPDETAKSSVAEEDIPVLTEVVEEALLADDRYSSEDLAGLEDEISRESLRLAEQLLHEVAREMEVVLFDRVLSRMKEELPTLVEKILRQHLQRDR
jgi:hypothetical protein